LAKHVIASIDEIPPGERKIVEVAGRSIGVFNVGGEYFALRNRCPHQGGPLCEGKQWGMLTARVPGEFEYGREGEIIGCGWHGWEFDIRTGQSWCEPERLRVRAYQVSVEPGAAIVAEPGSEGDRPAEDDPESPIPGRVKGPYVAETYPVSVDGQYVVVEVAP
jgi:3-phenylpropionate/trans-cinnamate dioxygenase ferredoxin subunit